MTLQSTLQKGFLAIMVFTCTILSLSSWTKDINQRNVKTLDDVADNMLRSFSGVHFWLCNEGNFIIGCSP